MISVLKFLKIMITKLEFKKFKCNKNYEGLHVSITEVKGYNLFKTLLRYNSGTENAVKL